METTGSRRLFLSSATGLSNEPQLTFAHTGITVELSNIAGSFDVVGDASVSAELAANSLFVGSSVHSAPMIVLQGAASTVQTIEFRDNLGVAKGSICEELLYGRQRYWSNGGLYAWRDATNTADLVQLNAANETTSLLSTGFYIAGGAIVSKILLCKSQVLISDDSLAFMRSEKLYVGGDVYVTEEVNIASTTAATSAATGALVAGGGVGIGLDLYVGDELRVLGTTAAIFAVTGALTVGGGVSIADDLYVGQRKNTRHDGSNFRRHRRLDSSGWRWYRLGSVCWR